MEPSSFSYDDLRWYRATTVSERIGSRRTKAGPARCAPSSAAMKLWHRWRTQVSIQNDLLISQRLQSLGVSDNDFLTILDEPMDSIRAQYSETPEWVQQLLEAFSNYSPRADYLPTEGRDPIFKLLSIARPLIAWGVSKLEEGAGEVVRKHGRLVFNLKLLERACLNVLESHLLSIVSKVTILEMHIARLQGAFDGKTQRERYTNFLARLGQPEAALALMLEYPVMARQLVVRVTQWVEAILEFLDRLSSDWDLITQTLVPLDSQRDVLTHLQMDSGDRHRCGRSVMVATFTSGLKLVYKPKSMAVDAHFQELLVWVNARGSEPPLQPLKVIDRGSYGWSEFVTPRACHSLSELQRFYRRQGAYLALLYVLEATDFHSENVIAAGEHPFFVDGEAIFHPRLKEIDPTEEPDSAALGYSVLRVGLLPRETMGSEESGVADISGLSGGRPEQLTPNKVPYWVGVGTDEIRLSRRKMEMPPTDNRPSLNGLEVNPDDYLQEILEGFSGMYRLLMSHRDDLVASNGPLQRFANDEVRVVFRSTRTYGTLLMESFHPDVMRDAVDRDLLFDRLWIGVEQWPYLAQVVSAECEDLQRGDIPFFSTRPQSLDVWTSTKRCIPGLIEKSALSHVEQRVADLSEDNLSLQLWLIRASLAIASGHSRLTPSFRSNSVQPHGVVDRSGLLAAACTAGDHLVSTALRLKGSVSWVGLSVADDDRWSIGGAELDLYDGLPGIALFLAYLGCLTAERRYTDLARLACTTILRRVEKYNFSSIGIGGFAGWGGVLYSLSQVGAVLGDSTLTSIAGEIVRRSSGLVGSDENLDVIAGAAGYICSLLAFHRQQPSADALAAARECGIHLLGRARKMPVGIGWIIPKQTVPLCGFAHGAAGFGWALLQLAECTGAEIFRTAAEDAILYERELFDCETGNWPDLRTACRSNDEAPMSAWCHGATGIGIARLTSPIRSDNDEAHQEIDAALRTTMNTVGQNHSLCHGDAGSIELLLQAYTLFRDERWKLEAYRIASGIAEDISRNDYHCGNPLKIVTPALMTGVAGIGYELLRLAEPDRVPCVLTLQSPTQACGGLQ